MGQAVDLNEDGRLDLVGATAATDLQIATGRGDGTFDATRSLNVRALPLAAGDFNGDGHADLVITGVSILPGRGDGSFGSARVVDSTANPPGDIEIQPRALVADFNGDGANDLVLLDDGFVCVYPGRGDFTFGPRVELTSPGGPLSLAAADFNNDGRMDLAASTASATVDVFLNRGGFLFGASSLPVAFSMFDIASGDFNKDLKQDLVVAMTGGASAGYVPGAFHVILGNGNGTFQTPVAHATGARGALSVAVGDFNHDGNPDVATGNRSTLNVDTNCTGFVYWDSVTIAPGAGNGTFGEPATFRLGTRNGLDETVPECTERAAGRRSEWRRLDRPRVLAGRHAAEPGARSQSQSDGGRRTGSDNRVWRPTSGSTRTRSTPTTTGSISSGATRQVR